MKLNTSLNLVIGFAIGLAISSSAFAVDDLAIYDEPLFLVSVPPNVMVMLDNSGSMKNQLYKSDNPYSNAVNYYGIFDYDKNYEYDASIPVNTAAYSVTVDGDKTGAFVESNCTPAVGNTTCWSGRFLNWLSSKRIDASRRVLVGGKLESYTDFNYGTDLNYKIVGNNEPDDKVFSESATDSDSYSPIPNNHTVTVSSPANDNKGQIQTKYDPYAKIYTSSGAGLYIYNSADQVIGEFGSVTTSRNESWKTVNFTNTFASVPIVVAKPPTYDDEEPGVVRIRNVTASSFQIKFREWKYLDNQHEAETIKYIALRQGLHTLPGGMYAQAGKEDSVDSMYNSDDCGHGVTDSTSVTYTDMDNVSFTGTPIVIASVTTHEGSDSVSVRVWDVSNTGFKVAMQEEEDEDNSHADEDISWIVFNQGTVNDTTNFPNWKLETKLYSGVDENDETITFDTTTFETPPSVLAGIQTLVGDNAAALRIKSISKTDFTTFVEEEASCDAEVGHTDEDIGYVALQAGGEYNVALVVKDKPTGLLHDIEDQVRLGISFYRYDPAVNNIYNGNKIQGGTLNFKIPINPYVKKPTNSSLPESEQGYRELSGYVGSTLDNTVDAINNYPLVWGTTPLAENLWEVIQYFEQDEPHYPDVEVDFSDFETADSASNNELDPYYYPEYGEKLKCAKSSVIIFTDGAPYRDADIPAEVVDYDDDSKADDLASTDVDEHGKDNLDDVAMWAYCDNDSTDVCSSTEGGTRDLRSDLANETIDGREYGQHLKVYTVGFADGAIRQILQDTADNAGGNAYAAEDGVTLKTALTEAFTAAINDSSASSVAVTTGSITSTSAVFQALFNSNLWTGELLAYPINSDGTLGSSHNAADIPGESTDTAATSRKIITYNGSQGVPFQFPADLSDIQSTDISLAQATSLGSSGVLDYIRGDQSNEELNGGIYRDRDSLLGDIINSSPSYVGSSSVFSYADSLESASHSTFKTSLSRTPVVYVGANDGMLHAFNATVTDTDDDGTPEFPAAFGNEIFAYVPGFMYDKLDDLSSPDYSHKYTVDGVPVVGDAFFNNAWHTVLVAGVGSGGQGIYAIDVTSTSVASESTGAAKVLWEFTDVDDDGDQADGNIGEKGDLDLGYTYSKPNIVRMANGKWAAVFGNGYNNTVLDGNYSTDGNAVLYIVDIETGLLIKKIDTGIGHSATYSGNKPNGLSTVAPVDIDGDSVIDYIYGGDLYGHLWKFDVNSSDISDWDVYAGKPLFSACAADTCDNTNRQPITVRPQVGYKKGDAGYMVFFGTGKYLETSDDSAVGQTTQSFYGIWDQNYDEGTFTTIGRSSLQQQQIIKEVSEFSYDLRVTTNEPMGSGDLGWYMDLINVDGGNTNNYGERQVSDPILRNGRIIFTTLIPSSDPCEYGGTSWLMELDAQQGARLSYTPFDLNGDGEYNSGDYVEVVIDGETVKIPVSGKKSKVGITNTPGIVSDEDKEYKYTSGSTGHYEVTSENPGLEYVGRQSWNRLDQ